MFFLTYSIENVNVSNVSKKYLWMSSFLIKLKLESPQISMSSFSKIWSFKEEKAQSMLSDIMQKTFFEYFLIVGCKYYR